MPITVQQDWSGAAIEETGDGGSIDSGYVIRGTTDEFAAHFALKAFLAATAGGLVLQTARITGRIGLDSWRGEAEWGNLEPQTTGDSTFQFDTGGGTTHVSQAIATTASYAASGTAPDFNGAIGVTSSGVDGCDIVTPKGSFSETHQVAASTVTTDYKKQLYFLTGCVNNASFKGLAAGECLFLGASGSKKNAENWEITYKFMAAENVTGLSVGSITGIDKKGHEYLWVLYQEEEDATANRIVRRPVAAYVEQVYPTGNLSLLGI